MNRQNWSMRSLMESAIGAILFIVLLLQPFGPSICIELQRRANRTEGIHVSYAPDPTPVAVILLAPLIAFWALADSRQQRLVD